MNCEKCGKEKAVLHIVETIGENRGIINICKKCDEEFDIIEKCLECLENSDIDLFSEFPNVKSTRLKKLTKLNKNKKIYNEICNICGYSLNDFLETKNASCPKCYESFRVFIDKKVRAIHNANKHIGKKPSGNLSREDIEKEIIKNENNMELLIKMEKYEEAGEIKKKIEALNEVLMSKEILSEKRDVSR